MKTDLLGFPAPKPQFMTNKKPSKGLENFSSSDSDTEWTPSKERAENTKFSKPQRPKG